jgi:hypothetical protein
MANLQREINAGTNVASVGEAPPADTSVAEAIQAVGSQVKTFVVEKKKTDLEQELETLGDEVFAARTGTELQKATDRFKRLQQGQEQGVLSDTMVKIEAEKLLKESIDSMPAFGPELRQHAAQILGYDPTGTHIRALMDIPENSAGRQTFADKQLEQAQFISENLDLPVNTVLKLQAKGLLQKQRADLVTQQATIGAAGRRDIFNATMLESDTFVTGFMQDMMGKIRSGEFIDNPEETISLLEAHKLGQKQALRDRYAAAGISPDATELSRDMAAVDEQWGSLKELAQTGSLGNILNNNATDLGNALTIDGYNVMGDVAIMNKMGGQEAVKNFFTSLRKYGKKEQLDLLASTNPALRRFLDSQDTAVQAAAESYKRIMGVEPDFIDGNVGRFVTQEERDALGTLDDSIFYDIAKTSALSDEEKMRRLNYAQQQGQRYKVLGAYFQKGGKQAASAEEVRFVRQTFKEEYPRLVARLSAELANFTDIEVSIKGNQLSATNTAQDPLNTSALVAQGSAGIIPISSRGTPASLVPVPESIRNDLTRVNSFAEGVRNGWARDLGQNPATFINDALTDVHNGKSQNAERQDALNSAIQAFEQNPTTESLEALRKLDPELVNSIERAAASSLGSGGDNNAQ